MIEIHQALKQAAAELNHPEGRLEAELLLAQVLNCNRAYLFTHPQAQLSSLQKTQYEALIQKRVEGLPIAYLTGQREFWSLNLSVNEHTLIPRHETERLVELALELIPDSSDTRVLDLGTGSGALALALAKEKPHWHIHASELNQGALDIAQENAKKLGLQRIYFYHSNWFETLPKIKYHAILSNPPYLAAGDPHLSQGDLRFEPLNALVSGQDGLADLQCIINQSPKFLLTKGLLLLEHGFEQKIAVASILNRAGYQEIHCWQDLLGHDRVSGGWYP